MCLSLTIAADLLDEFFILGVLCQLLQCRLNGPWHPPEDITTDLLLSDRNITLHYIGRGSIDYRMYAAATVDLTDTNAEEFVVVPGATICGAHTAPRIHIATGGLAFTCRPDAGSRPGNAIGMPASSAR
eukprot:COSAG02_NODE_8242_length_2645_cov_1.472113_3_plen_129_part_00